MPGRTLKVCNGTTLRNRNALINVTGKGRHTINRNEAIFNNARPPSPQSNQTVSTNPLRFWRPQGMNSVYLLKALQEVTCDSVVGEFVPTRISKTNY